MILAAAVFCGEPQTRPIRDFVALPVLYSGAVGFLDRRRRPVIGIGVIFIMLAIVGCGGSSSSVLGHSLPSMVHDFGAGARVVRLDIAKDRVDYEVLASDGTLHRRVYACGTQSCPDTSADVPVIKPSAVELRTAAVQLSAISPGVVDKLLSRIGVAANASDVRLEGDTWTITSSERAGDVWQARYDGAGLELVNPSTTAAGTAPSSPTSPAAGAPNVTLPPGAASSIARSEKLLSCVEAAHQHFNKILACERRFQP